jgi:hypothetical protein
MNRDQARAYIDRDWGLFERIDRDAAREALASEDPLAAHRIACALYEHMRAVRPDWPSERERAADFAHHVELKRILERASRALAAR